MLAHCKVLNLDYANAKRVERSKCIGKLYKSLVQPYSTWFVVLAYNDKPNIDLNLLI